MAASRWINRWKKPHAAQRSGLLRCREGTRRSQPEDVGPARILSLHDALDEDARADRDHRQRKRKSLIKRGHGSISHDA
jgi:hypothetical protein